MKRKLLILLGFSLVAVVCLLFFDVFAYFFMPKEWIKFAPAYRRQEVYVEQGYPRGYFRADDQLGFDIQPNSGLKKYTIANGSFDIFSNELGCFDRNSLAQIKETPEYTYFAGDSFTWGYADYEKKFTTVYESKTGRLSVKCGVTHSGQRHQYEKFLRVVKAIGRYPERVFVGYFQNDPANDFAYPHSTVIDGFLVDTVELKNNALVKADMSKAKDKIRETIENLSNPAPEIASVKQVLMHYSLTFHLISRAITRVRYIAGALIPAIGSRPFDHVSRQFSFKDSYLSSDITLANREAIKKWGNDAKANDYELVFLLIPAIPDFNDLNYYRALKQFLSENDIDYYDLAEAFHDAKKTVSELYWDKDGHWNNEGNVVVGELLAKRFPNGTATVAGADCHKASAHLPGVSLDCRR